MSHPGGENVPAQVGRHTLLDERERWLAALDRFQPASTRAQMDEMRERLAGISDGRFVGIRLYRPPSVPDDPWGAVAVVDLNLNGYNLPLTWAQLLLVDVGLYEGNRYDYVAFVDAPFADGRATVFVEPHHVFECREVYWRCGDSPAPAGPP